MGLVVINNAIYADLVLHNFNLMLESSNHKDTCTTIYRNSETNDHQFNLDKGLRSYIPQTGGIKPRQDDRQCSPLFIPWRETV